MENKAETGLQLVVNGESRTAKHGLTVEGLLQELNLTAGRVAIERNLEILPRSAWAGTSVENGDRYEIVQFVGGG